VCQVVKAGNYAGIARSCETLKNKPSALRSTYAVLKRLSSFASTSTGSRRTPWKTTQTRPLGSGEEAPATTPQRPRGIRRPACNAQARALTPRLLPPATDCLYDAQARAEYGARTECDIALQ
jgi:hypothetical protein